MVNALRNWLARLLVGNVYEAAQYSTRRSRIHSTYTSARFDISTAPRQTIAQKARYYERNSWLVNKLADIFESGTVGTGLVVQPATESEDWNQRASTWWQTWCKFPDATSRQNFGTLQGLMARTWFVDGEAFILKSMGRVGPRVQLIEGHLVRTPEGQEKNPRWVDGLLTDANGRPTGYAVHSEEESGKYKLVEVVPAERVWHLFEPQRPGQYRGISFLAPVLNALHDLDDLWKLEMQVAKLAGTLGVLKTNSTGTFDPHGFRRSQVTRSTVSANNTATTETTTDLIEDATGAMAIALGNGEDIKQFIASRPTEQQRAHWTLITKAVCIGVGIPYVMVDPDSMQGTVYRGSLDLAASFFAQRSSVIADACRDIYGYVMSVARNTPELSGAPTEYWAANVLPPRGVNVDVGYTMSANLQSLQAGTDDLETILSPRGLDWRTVLRRKAEQAAYIKELAAEYGVEPSDIANISGKQEVVQQGAHEEKEDEKTDTKDEEEKK